MQSGFFDRNSVFEPYLHVRLLIAVEQSHQLCLVDLPLPGGGARRQAAVSCKDRGNISGLELENGKHERANINAF